MFISQLPFAARNRRVNGFRFYSPVLEAIQMRSFSHLYSASKQPCILSPLLAIVTFLTFVSPSSAAIIVGGFDLSRGGDYSIADSNLTQMSTARLLFQSIEPSTTFTSTPILTPAYLATVDILVLSAVRVEPTTLSPLNLSEQSALFNFVAAGGRALISVEHSLLNFSGPDPVYESLLDPFGIDVDGSVNATATLSNPLHPIFDGPFGTLANVQTGTSGYFSNLGPYATGLAFLAGNPNRPMIATIEGNAIAPGSGRVIFLADGNVLNPNSVPITQVLAFAGNGATYLVVVPEVGTFGMTATACVCGVGIGTVRRRKRLSSSDFRPKVVD